MATADLSVVKNASPSPVGIGQPLNYIIEVKNNDITTPISAILTDNLPSGICIQNITVTLGNYCLENSTINWDIGTLSALQTETLTIVVVPQNAGSITNVATVNPGPGDEDPDYSNNTSSVTLEVTPTADLSIFKESCPLNALLGERVEYSITVLNNGPSAAYDVTVKDSLPSGVVVIPPLPSGCTQSGNIITCNMGRLDPNERGNIRLTVETTAEGQLHNIAEVSSSVPDPNPNNNKTEAVTNVASSADISITKITSDDVVRIGDIFNYTLFVKNNGPSTATNVTVIDSLPSTVEYISHTQTQGGYTSIGNVFTFTLGTLAPSVTAVISIKVRGIEEGLITNSAVVTASETDPNPCNNDASVCSYISRSTGTDIQVKKVHTPEPAGVCSPVLYTITVTNNGPISATGITLVDQLPSSLEVLCINTSQGKCCLCNESGRQQCCSGCEKDRKGDDSGNESQTCSSQNFAGEAFTEQESQNIGDTTSNIMVTDSIQNYQTDSTNYDCLKKHCHNNDDFIVYNCDNKEPFCSRISEITCQLGSLSVGSSAVVQILARPRMIGTVSNTAIVTANEFDLDPTNNEVTDTLTVIPICEQMENLIKKVDRMIANGELDDKHGKTLINLLNDAKISLCCSSTPGTIGCKNDKEELCDLEEFVDKVKIYIHKNFISEAHGCELIKDAEHIIMAVRCNCKCLKYCSGKVQ